MYNTANALEETPGILTLKLVSGKITYVDPAFVPDVIRAVSGYAPWQTRNLPAPAMALLARVEDAGELEIGKLTPEAKALEARLLVQTTSVHTASGAHAKVLRSWARWAQALGPDAPERQEAEAGLSAWLATLNEAFGGRGMLPWAPRKRR
jgi:hypothetical protein